MDLKSSLGPYFQWGFVCTRRPHANHNFTTQDVFARPSQTSTIFILDPARPPQTSTVFAWPPQTSTVLSMKMPKHRVREVGGKDGSLYVYIYVLISHVNLVMLRNPARETHHGKVSRIEARVPVGSIGPVGPRTHWAHWPIWAWDPLGPSAHILQIYRQPTGIQSAYRNTGMLRVYRHPPGIQASYR